MSVRSTGTHSQATTKSWRQMKASCSCSLGRWNEQNWQPFTLQRHLIIIWLKDNIFVFLDATTGGAKVGYYQILLRDNNCGLKCVFKDLLCCWNVMYMKICCFYFANISIYIKHCIPTISNQKYHVLTVTYRNLVLWSKTEYPNGTLWMYPHIFAYLCTYALKLDRQIGQVDTLAHIYCRVYVGL